MEKNLSALGFMSGTSGDGVDSSVITSNGKDSIVIKYNRLELIDANDQLDQRRLFSESVLSGVFSGVIGLD